MRGLAFVLPRGRLGLSPSGARKLAVMIGLFAYSLGLPLATAEKPSKPDTSPSVAKRATTLRIVDPDLSQIRQVSGEIWISSDDPPVVPATLDAKPSPNETSQPAPEPTENAASVVVSDNGNTSNTSESSVPDPPAISQPESQSKRIAAPLAEMTKSPPLLSRQPTTAWAKPDQNNRLMTLQKPPVMPTLPAVSRPTPVMPTLPAVSRTTPAKTSVSRPLVTPVVLPDREARIALLQQVPSPPIAVKTPQPATQDSQQADTAEFGPFEIIDHTDELSVTLRRSKLLRTKVDIYRTAVVDPAICDVVQFTPREVSIIGKGQGATHVTFWFEDESHRPITYLIRVVPDPEVQERREEQYGLLEEHLAELFPNSKVHLVPVADKLIVKGQAKGAAEAAQILSVIRGQMVTGRTSLVDGRAAKPLSREETNQTLPATQVINMLRVPGVQQVALRVKIAELNRSAARNFGVDMNMDFHQGELLLQSLLNAASGGAATILGSFDGGDIEFGIHYLEKHGVMRMLSEPTLVTLSGRPATFIAGGEFAVPTTVGVGGAAAVTTDFRAYGAIITFMPVVLDKDHIRLEVAPEFSQIDSEMEVNGTPGLSTRAVTTTVEMREGQTLAIAGLLDDSMQGDNEGDLPIVAQIFGKREVTRNETELIILVTPELVHPMDPEEVPPLPGFDVTEPNNTEFFLHGRLEGRPTQDYRSTVWPRLRRRYEAGGDTMISGPFGHGN